MWLELHLKRCQRCGFTAGRRKRSTFSSQNLWTISYTGESILTGCYPKFRRAVTGSGSGEVAGWGALGKETQGLCETVGPSVRWGRGWIRKQSEANWRRDTVGDAEFPRGLGVALSYLPDTILQSWLTDRQKRRVVYYRFSGKRALTSQAEKRLLLKRWGSYFRPCSVEGSNCQGRCGVDEAEG